MPCSIEEAVPVSRDFDCTITIIAEQECYPDRPLATVIEFDDIASAPSSVSAIDIARTQDEEWLLDRAQRADPEKLTALFHAAVPVLKFIDWTVIDTKRGYAQSILPLNVTATNQHIAHQAAVILIAADYTGGIALGSIFHGVPLVGIHPQSSDYGAYLWGAKADIKWILPSIDDLVCTATIAPGRHDIIARRFFQGRRVLETVHVEMKNGDTLVAEANLTYWAQDTHSLRRHAFDEDKIHDLYDHRQKASARLIAGLRAIEQERPVGERLFNDPVALSFARTHGLILARRFCLVAPQIQPMVAARTRHLDDVMTQFHNDLPCQIINIGAGLDTRLYRVSLPAGSKIFDVDLPTMLRQRREVFDQVQFPNLAFVQVPIDLREHDLGTLIIANGEFDPAVPTMIIWEGGSMYFQRKNIETILGSLHCLMGHAQSLLWMDYVHASVSDGTSEYPVVKNFTHAMQCLGEPFVNGFSEIEPTLQAAGLELVESVPSGLYQKANDPIFELYRFCVARAV